MTSRTALFTSFFASVLMAAGPASAAWFMKMDTVPGGSMSPQEIELQSWSFGGTSSQGLDAGRALPAARSGGPGTLMITKTVDKATPNLMRFHSQRKQIPTLVIERKAGSSQEEYLKITLKDCLISSYQTGGSAGPTESLSINFSRIEFQYQNPPKPATAKTLGGPDTLQQKK